MGKLIVIALALAALIHQSTAVSRLEVPGGELAYESTGSGRQSVVLLHGAFVDRGSWDAQVPALAQRFRVVRYDLRPFGDSHRLEKAYSPPDDLLRLLDHLGMARVHLVGHSFGGTVAIDFALLHPDRVASLTLAAAGPSGFVAPEDERKAAGAIFAQVKHGDEAILDAWLAHPMWSASRDRPEVLKAIRTSTSRSLPAFRLPFAPYVPLKPSAVTRLGEIKAPTLVLVGDRDTPGNRQASEMLGAQIPGAKLVIVPGADHALPIGWSDAFNREVSSFISATR